MRLGVLIDLQPNVEDGFRPLKELGLSGCQLGCWDDSLFTAEIAGKVRAVAEDLGARISSLWCGWPGPRVWDFSEGYLTLGLVPPEYRYARLEFLKRGSDFAKLLGV
ncbi:MAG: sugar phosphate isomerase/epimerase, partial [Treponema sp.]|nr:sugar phosphate isomerase/epimerase [Treponema sp.]